jgi:ferric-dicitrate binding protein FerR (iron transport regulator)
MAFQWIDPIRLRSLAAVSCLLFCLPLRAAQAQSDTCTLRPNKHNQNERILRCGTDLTVQPAPGTAYRPVDAGERGPPAAVRLDSGALLIEFHPTKQRRDFQILTPLAIAAVRGTRWAVEARPDRTSVLVLTGAVNVSRANAAATAVVLQSGQGVDVTPEGGPLRVERWRPERVKALLARFAQ